MFGRSPMFSTKPDVSMVMFHFENDFKYKSQNMEVMYGSPYRYLLTYSLRKWKYGDGKKNRVRDYCRF